MSELQAISRSRGDKVEDSGAWGERAAEEDRGERDRQGRMLGHCCWAGTLIGPTESREGRLRTKCRELFVFASQPALGKHPTAPVTMDQG